MDNAHQQMTLNSPAPNAATSRPATPSVEERSATDTVCAMINSLFAAGLDLCAARSMVEGEAADRIDRAIGGLDEAIADLRSRLFEFAVIDLTECRRRNPVAGH